MLLGSLPMLSLIFQCLSYPSTSSTSLLQSLVHAPYDPLLLSSGYGSVSHRYLLGSYPSHLIELLSSLLPSPLCCFFGLASHRTPMVLLLWCPLSCSSCEHHC
ncbi:MAG: hypothetical protein [Cressdnaviricota sp.]|nr:MAG: hypothetical protein [Cressdnaviricota sp.]